MAPLAVISAVVLICAASVHGFVGESTKSVEGIHDGRFGIDGIKISAQAVFTLGGVTGNVLFTQSKPGQPVQIHVNLLGLDQFPDAYPWTIHNYPVRASLLNDFPCSNENLGGVFDDVGARNGPLNHEEPWQTFTDPDIILSGPNSIIGRSLVIDRQFGVGGEFICANIEQLGARREIIRAPFDNENLQGEVVIRYSIGRDDATIEADLFGTDTTMDNSGGVTWSLHYGTAGPGNSCDNVFGAIFGSTTTGGSFGTDFQCSRDRQRECRIGDLTSKCGPLSFEDGRIHTFCTDNQIGSTPRHYLVDEVATHALALAIRAPNGTALGCSQLELVQPLTGRSMFRTNAISGDFRLWQTGPDDRTYIQGHLTGLRLDRTYFLRIYENALSMNQMCTPGNLGNVVSRKDEFILPGDTTSGGIGNLGSLIPLQGVTSYRDTTFSNTLPLFGPNTVLGNTLALVRDDGQILACGTIEREREYPVGEISSLQGYQSENNPPVPPLPSAA